jgi:arsenate reductase
MADLTIFFNPRCSKCRTAEGLLAERGIADPRQMMRTGEPIYAELDLAEVEGDDLLTAIAAHPVLLERPIVVAGAPLDHVLLLGPSYGVLRQVAQLHPLQRRGMG